MELNTFQERALETNQWPRMFSEDQVVQIVDDVLDEIGFTRIDHAGLKYILNKHTDPLGLLIYPVLGLLEEAGEIAGKLKKVIRDDEGKINEEKKDSLVLEAGDVLWYLSAISEALDVKFNDVARLNVEKLASRAARGTLHGSGDHR